MKKIDYYQQRRREQYCHDYTQYPLPCNTVCPACHNALAECRCDEFDVFPSSAEHIDPKIPEAVPEHLLEAKAQTSLPAGRWADVLESLKTEDRTRFGLFQAMTGVASHKLSGMNAISIGDSIGTYFLDNADQG